MRFAPLAFFLFPFLASAATIHLSETSAPAVERKHSFLAAANRHEMSVAFHLATAETEKALAGGHEYQKLTVPGLPLTSDPGLPALPFQAVTVDAAASDVIVRPVLGRAVEVNVGRLFPAQESPCRCATATPRAFRDDSTRFAPNPSGFRIESLGDFRGQPVTRVLLTPHRYDTARGVLTLYPEARFEISYGVAAVAPKAEPLYDYLVITPSALRAGLTQWIAGKERRQGLRFSVVNYEDLHVTDAAGLGNWIHGEYARAQFRYALLVGGRAQIPQASVETSTTHDTPSDLPYFTMGGANDNIPDVYAGRVVASDVTTLQRILGKWTAYEEGQGAAGGWGREIGVASNQQGSGPSDAAYITAIQDSFRTNFGTSAVYLFQNNSDSNPIAFNNQLAQGANWVTYIGHGSGTSWPSFGQEYLVSDIQKIRNAAAVKPVWLDVACLNGRLEEGAAGAHLASEADPSGQAIGVTAYLGGTVLISWDPPAIFARGVATQLAGMVSPTLGEAIQAGQRYLTENISNALDIASSQRWYHLQGDPSMRLRLK